MFLFILGREEGGEKHRLAASYTGPNGGSNLQPFLMYRAMLHQLSHPARADRNNFKDLYFVILSPYHKVLSNYFILVNQQIL